MGVGTLPFGRLLVDPHCTRDSLYIPSIIKALVSLCNDSSRSDMSLSAIKALQERLLSSRKALEVDSALFERLMNHLFVKCKDPVFFIESFLLMTSIMLPNKSLEWRPVFWRGFERLVQSPQDALRLDAILNSFNVDLYQWLVGYSKECEIDAGFFEILCRVLASRFDDDYSGAWSLCLDFDRHWLPSTILHNDQPAIVAFVNFLSMLCRVSFSEQALDMVIRLCDKLFTSGLDFIDEDQILCTAISSLVTLILKAESESNRNWLLTSIASNIRRIVPPTRTAQCSSAVFSNLLHLLRPFVEESGPVLQAFLAFIKNFAAPQGICKNISLAKDYISVSMSYLGISNLPGLASELLTDVLAHCEGSAQMVGVDCEYLGLLGWFIDTLTCVGVTAFSLPLIGQRMKSSHICILMFSVIGSPFK